MPDTFRVITPVKDSIDSTLETVRAVLSSRTAASFTYTVYNDFSTKENTERLEKASEEMGFELVNLSDMTSHPSPNYLLVLRTEQKKCLEAGCPLVIVESDVLVREDTIQGLLDGACQNPECGIAASVTVDSDGVINYPYEYARGQEGRTIDTRRHCSFCCSLLTNTLLSRFDFGKLDERKSWYDVTISHESLRAGLHNILFAGLPVIHRPHSSRPWKQLKYRNPLLYYWRKLTKGFDRI